MAETSLQTQWAVCGIAAAAARFVPVPMVGDVVRRRATQVAVLRTLRAHGRDLPAERVEALWDETDDRRRGLRGLLRQAPGKVVLFPVRKYTAVFGAVRGVPDDVARVVLLARSVDRVLERGALASADRAPDEARALRRAVDDVIAGLDLQVLTAGLADGLSGTRGLTTAAVALVRRRLAGEEADDAAVPVDSAVAEGAARVDAVLRRPEMTALLQRFDAAVDAALARGR